MPRTGQVTIVPPGLSPEREAEATRVKRRRRTAAVVSRQDVPSLRTGLRLPRGPR